MASHNRLGAEGELAAAFHLIQKGYTLRDRNWRVGHLEIDIVADWFGEVVFVEVKTRSDEHYADAAEAVTDSKKRNLIAAAHAYLAQNKLQDAPYRFDILTVIGKSRPFRIHHYRNAYNERTTATGHGRRHSPNT